MTDRPLTKTQARLLAAVERTHSEEPSKLRAVRHSTHDRVRKALNGGVPAVLIAERMGLTRSRIYQMRDQANAYDVGG